MVDAIGAEGGGAHVIDEYVPRHAQTVTCQARAQTKVVVLKIAYRERLVKAV